MNRKTKYYLDLITVLTFKELKVRYKSSFLGYLWSIGHPLAFAFVFFIAFKVVMRVGIDKYALFLISGLFPWQWFANSVNSAPAIFLANAPIIKKVNFPRNFIPLTLILQDMIHFILSIPVIVFFLLIYRELPSLSWLYGIPLLLFLQFFMTYGICLFISSANLFFRDLERLTVIFTTLLLYFTPVIYPETMIPPKYLPLVSLNPLAPLMISWRMLFLKGTLDPWYLSISLFYSLAAFSLGYLVYRKLSWRFAEVL